SVRELEAERLVAMHAAPLAGQRAPADTRAGEPGRRLEPARDLPLEGAHLLRGPPAAHVPCGADGGGGPRLEAALLQRGPGARRADQEKGRERGGERQPHRAHITPPPGRRGRHAPADPPGRGLTDPAGGRTLRAQAPSEMTQWTRSGSSFAAVARS